MLYTSQFVIKKELFPFSLPWTQYVLVFQPLETPQTRPRLAIDQEDRLACS